MLFLYSLSAVFVCMAKKTSKYFVLSIIITTFAALKRSITNLRNEQNYQDTHALCSMFFSCADVSTNIRQK